jgi:putative transposase
MAELDRQHLDDPTAGTRRLIKYLERTKKLRISRNRMRRLMRQMGIEAVYPHKRTTIPGGPSGIFPYLLKNMVINGPGQVWAVDITYIPMRRGFMYLFAIIDWYSRKVVGWELSTTLDVGFCLSCLKRAIRQYGAPEVINSDQGCHFTSEKWRECVQGAGIKLSMDGRGRWLDNVVIERFWRTIKYEDIYLQSYATPNELEKGIKKFILRYNMVRPHQALSWATPDEIHNKWMDQAV